MKSFKLVVYFPSSDRRGEAIPPEVRDKALLNLLEHLTDLYGGATEMEGRGWWKGQHTYIHEDVTIIWSFMSETDWDVLGGVTMQLLKDLKKDLNQDSLAYELNGALTLL